MVFGFLLACYLLTYTGYIQSSDGLAMYATADSIARRGEFDSNQILWMGNQQGNIGADGNLYSRKGLGMTLLALPLVWTGLHWDHAGMVQMALLLNPILTALTGALIYRAGKRLGWKRATAVSTALGFGLATMAWPYTQEFFSDPVCGFGLFAAFYGLLSFSQTGRKAYLVGGGIAWGIAYLARNVNLMTLPVFLVGLWVVLVMRVRIVRRIGTSEPVHWRDVLHGQWRPMVSFLVPVVVAGLLSLWWNHARFGSIWDSGYVESEAFSANWLFGLFGLTVGPARGLIWYNPILLLSIPGAIWFWRHARRSFWLIIALTVLYFGVYAKWYMWHGGYSWGPRFLVPLLPFLALFAGPAWERLVFRRRYGWLGAIGAVLLAALSVGVQWLGMAVPYGLVQDLLAAEVQPLFAPETFTRISDSPLVLQWRFLTPEHIHFAWWRSAQTGSLWSHVDWLGLLMPLVALVVGLVILVRQARWNHEYGIDRPRNYAYLLALTLIILATLTYIYRPARASELAELARRIAAGERRAGDAILHLDPPETQQLANTYHGRLGTLGLAGGAPVEQVDSTLDMLVQRGVERLWVVPDSTPPEQSAWEVPLREDHFLLSETRPTGADGRRLALYALAGVQEQTETGLGVVFGDPALGEEPVTDANGWFKLAGYGLTPSVHPGGEILLTLRWNSLREVANNYQVFVHLVNERGEKVAQRDGQPVQWLRPTSTWKANEEIFDRYGIPLPEDLPPGAYSIRVGLYDPVTGQRLPVSAGPGDFAIEIGPVVVTP